MQVFLTEDSDGDKVYSVPSLNSPLNAIPRSLFRKIQRQGGPAAAGAPQWTAVYNAVATAVANNAVIDQTGLPAAGIMDPSRIAAAAAGAHLNNTGSNSALGSAIAYTVCVDAVTTGAADATVSIALPFEAKIIDIELAEDSADVKSRLLTATQNGQKFVDNAGVSGASASVGVPAATFAGTSLIRRRFAGRTVDSVNKIDLVFHHYAAGKTTIILHLDKGPGGACPR